MTSSFVQIEHFYGVHVVRIPLRDRQQTAAASTTMHRLRVLHRVFVREQVANVASAGVEHADARTVVRDQDVSAQVHRQAARTAKPSAAVMRAATPRPRSGGHRHHGRRQRTSRGRHVTAEHKPTTCM